MNVRPASADKYSLFVSVVAKTAFFPDETIPDTAEEMPETDICAFT